MESEQIDKISYLFNEITKILEENKVERYEGKLEKNDWRFILGKKYSNES